MLATLGDGRPPAVDGDRLDPDAVVGDVESRPGHGVAAHGRGAGADPLCQAEGAPWCWSAMSPKTGRSPGRGSSSTWSTPCSISRATAATSSASCARSRTASAPTDEIGVFEMSDRGLREVQNPSRLSSRRRDGRRAPGSAVMCRHGGHPAGAGRAAGAGCALAARHPAPRRRRLDSNRLAMILAVLEARAGLRIGAHDVYLNVAGGLRCASQPPISRWRRRWSRRSPGAAAAQARAVRRDALSGAVRPVGQSEQRLKEAAKLGLTSAVIAANGGEPAAPRGLRLKRVENVGDLVAWVAGLPRQQTTAVKPLRRPVTEG